MFFTFHTHSILIRMKNYLLHLCNKNTHEYHGTTKKKHHNCQKYIEISIYLFKIVKPHLTLRQHLAPLFQHGRSLERHLQCLRCQDFC